MPNTRTTSTRTTRRVAAGIVAMAATAVGLVATTGTADAASFNLKPCYGSLNPATARTFHVGSAPGGNLVLRDAPTASANQSTGQRNGEAFKLLAQVWSADVFGSRNNHVVDFVQLPDGRFGYYPDAYGADTPTAANVMWSGVPVCGNPPASTPAGPGTFKNAAIANYALSYATGGYNEQKAGKYGGQCRKFINDVVSAVSGGRFQLGGEPKDYNQGFRRVGAYLVPSPANAIGGDIVQVGSTESDPHLHTYIIVKNLGNNRFEVVDSNHGHDEKVRHYDRTYTSGTIWRLGQP